LIDRESKDGLHVNRNENLRIRKPLLISRPCRDADVMYVITMWKLRYLSWKLIKPRTVDATLLDSARGGSFCMTTSLLSTFSYVLLDSRQLLRLDKVPLLTTQRISIESSIQRQQTLDQHHPRLRFHNLLKTLSPTWKPLAGSPMISSHYLALHQLPGAGTESERKAPAPRAGSSPNGAVS
jgi:hypothetical protein